MLYVILWFVSGLIFGVWGYYLEQKKDGLPIVMGLPLCMIFGPLAITALIEVWYDNRYATAVPWYKQGRQMAAEYKRHQKLAAAKKEELLEEQTLSQVYTVLFKDGKTLKQGMQYVPYIAKTYAPEYYYCWDIKSQKELQKEIISKLQKQGVVEGETVHPWHTVVEVNFE